MKISRKNALLACILSLTCGLPASHAATVTWTGATDSNWTTATNWDTGSVPVNGDTINIGTGGKVTADSGRVLTNNTLNLSGELSTQKFELKTGTTVYINDGASLTHTYSDVNLSGGTINQSGGTVTSKGASVWFNIGEDATGYYNMTGGTIDAKNFYVGRYNEGHMTVDSESAKITASNFYVGFDSSRAGDSTFTFKNGSITSSWVDIGGNTDRNNNGTGTNFGTVTFDMEGGTFTANGQTRVGVYVYGKNSKKFTNQTDVTLSGGTWNQYGHFYVEDGSITNEEHSQTANVTIDGTAKVNFKYDVIVGNGNGTGDGSNVAATLTLAGGTTTVLADTSTVAGSANAVCVGNGKNNTAKLLITGGNQHVQQARVRKWYRSV